MAGGAEALVDGVVFGIDGEQFPARLCGGGHDEFAGSDEDFLIGKRDGAAEGDGLVGGFEADNTDRGGDDDVRGGMSAGGEHAFAAVMDGGERREILFFETAREFVGELRGGDGDEFGMMAKDLREESVEIIAGGEDGDAEFVRKGFDDGEGLASDGAGAAEDGEGLHGNRKCKSETV